ncbi:hypothetical protein Efla_000027 [Eimeria flavescens]
MVTRQRKDKRGPPERAPSASDTKKKPQRQSSSTDSSPSPEGRVQTGKISAKSARQQADRGARSAFARPASLAVSGDEAPAVSAASGVNSAADQERMRREKEKKKAKREQERARHNRQEGGSRQKKAGRDAHASGFLGNITGSDFRSRVSSWAVYLLIAGGILGIFVLKALEEYYGLDDDVSGEERLKHLTVLGLEDGATESDVRKSYRTLSIRWHPDRNTNCGASCQQRFQEVAAAYEYLMRKQRKANADGEEEAGAEGGDASGFKVTSQGVVDFSALGPKDLFPPSNDTKHVWSVMVHQDKDDWSQSVYDMWQESSRTLGKYVKFGVITIRGRSGKDVLKKLPINVKIYPAILLMTAGMHPEQYPNISRPSVESINRFIADAFPSNVEVVSSAKALGAWLASSSSTHSLAGQYKVVIIPSGASSATPSLLVKHAAFANKQTFSFCFLANSRAVLANQKEELLNVLKNPPTWLTPVPADSAAAKALKLPVHLEELKEEELLSNSTVFLFMDEGRGLSRVQATLHSVRSKLLNPATALSLAIDRFREAMQPLLYQQTAASLCGGSLQRHVFCLVAVEPADEEAAGKRTVDLERIKSLLQESKRKYLEDNPRKNLEAIWERAVQQAKEHEGRRPQNTEEKTTEYEPDDKDEEDVHIEQPEDVEEEIIHVQVVRLSMGPPATLPSVSALPRDGLFLQFLKDQLNHPSLFLLDLEGSRVSPLPPLFVGDSDSAAGGSADVYKRLYQLLDDMQNSVDEEDESSRLSFSPLPEQCTGQEFLKKCLPSEQRSWLAYLFSGWTLLQVT